jgi:hypothetical protein
MPLDVDAVAGALLDAVDRALAPVLAKVAALELAVSTVGGRVGDLATAAATDHDRVVGLDARADGLGDVVGRAVAPTVERLAALEARVLGVPDALGALRERVAGMEARPPVPGPAGADGAPGRDGLDGLGFDDVTVDHDGDRTLTIRFVLGDRVKAFPVALPVIRYLGVYRDGTTYDRGDIVTWARSIWHCNAAGTTTRPGGSGAAWTLAVAGGKDGKDGPAGPAGPAGRDWQQVYDAMRTR